MSNPMNNSFEETFPLDDWVFITTGAGFNYVCKRIKPEGEHYGHVIVVDLADVHHFNEAIEVYEYAPGTIPKLNQYFKEHGFAFPSEFDSSLTNTLKDKYGEKDVKNVEYYQDIMKYVGEPKLKIYLSQEELDSIRDAIDEKVKPDDLYTKLRRIAEKQLV